MKTLGRFQNLLNVFIILKYKELYDVYPKTINADRIYVTRENRKIAKKLGVRIIGKPLGRPKKSDQTAKVKRARQKERDQRNVIEGKIGQTKNRYGLDKIAAKTDATTLVWVSWCIIVTNIARWLKELSLSILQIGANLTHFLRSAKNIVLYQKYSKFAAAEMTLF